jgi:D-beta-D-heptose 7-phosphate kinase/D-beta-D-heptose 1-phosphate adenosyltransferase
MRKTVYTGGTFDILHAGHIKFLFFCRKIAGDDGRVVVSLNNDDFIKKFKGKKPVFNYKTREEMLYKTGLVDLVVENEGGEDSKPAILKIKPDFIVIGSDWAKKDYYKQMGFSQEWLDKQGIVLIYVPYSDFISSTLIKNAVCGNSNSSKQR